MAKKPKEMAMDSALARRLDLEDEPLTNEEQRKLAFDMSTRSGKTRASRGIEFDVVGTMSISAALFALVAKHGKETTAEFVDDLAKSVRNDEFKLKERQS